MQHVLEYSRGRVPFGRGGGPDDWQIVVLRMDRTSILLGRELVADPKRRWSLVFLDAMHVVFLRNDGPNAELARRSAITPATLDVAEYIRRLGRMDPVASYSTYLGGFTLAQLGWNTPAIEVLDHVLKTYPKDPYRCQVWDFKGTCLAERGTNRMLQDPPDLGGKEDWNEARNCFLEALRLRSDYPPAIANLAEVEHQIDGEKRHIRFKYPWAPLESPGRN
jgi:tetratricopeptide (TPR) repeat protein